MERLLNDSSTLTVRSSGFLTEHQYKPGIEPIWADIYAWYFSLEWAPTQPEAHLLFFSFGQEEKRESHVEIPLSNHNGLETQ